MSSNNIPNLCFIDNKTNKCADNNYNRMYDNNGADVYKVNLLNSSISIDTKPEQNKSKSSNKVKFRIFKSNTNEMTFN